MAVNRQLRSRVVVDDHAAICRRMHEPLEGHKHFVPPHAQILHFSAWGFSTEDGGIERCARKPVHHVEQLIFATQKAHMSFHAATATFERVACHDWLNRLQHCCSAHVKPESAAGITIP